MSRSHFLKPFLLLGAIAASLGAGRALGQALDTVPIPTLSVNGARADSIVTDTRLTADRVWRLKGYTLVKTGRTLTIDPGTIIVGDPIVKGTLLVDTGAYLVAAGTAEQPITFKGPTEDRGGWGGIVILGRMVNNQGAYASFEGLPWARHGRATSTRNNDSSGVLTYVRLVSPGFPIDVDKELNGLTLCSVGNRTVIHHIHVHRGDDDGIEWFGGTVNTSHLVVTNAVDDSYDTDHGYSGNSQYMIAIQSLEPGVRPRPGLPAGEAVGDHIVECGSSTGNNTPYTNPAWRNLTFIENGIRGGVFNAKEDCGGTYEKMVMVASGVDTSVTSPWGMYIQGPDVLNRILAATPTITFPSSFLTGRYANKYLIDAGSASDRELAAELLDLDITALPHSQINSYGLYKDLRPSHPAIVAAQAGAIVGNDLWYQGWTLPGAVVFPFGDVNNAEAPTVTLNRAAGNLYAPASFTLNATAADPDGIASLQILRGNDVIASGTTGTLSFDVSGLAAGTYTYTVRATDGNPGPLTATASLEVVVGAGNASAPIVNLTPSSEDLVAPASFTLNAVASDPDGIASLRIFLGEELIGSSDNGILSVNLSNRPHGTYTYMARATDGHPVPQTTIFPLVVEIAAPPENDVPNADLTRPGGTLFAPASFTLIGSAADQHGIASLKIFRGDDLLAESETGAVTAEVSDLAPGTYTYTIEAIDDHPLDPKTYTKDLVVVVFAQQEDTVNAADPILIASKVGPEYLIAPANYELRAQADDADGISALEILLDGVVVGSGTARTLSVPILNKPAGTYTYTVRAVDNHGNNKKTATQELVVVVNTPNTAPTVNLTRTVGELFAGDDFTLNATAEDGDDIALLEILLNGVVVASSTTGSVSFEVSDPNAGTYVYVARATDKHADQPKTSTKDLQVQVRERPVSIAMRDLSDITTFGARGQSLLVDTKGYGKVRLSVWSLSGKRVLSRDVSLTQGRNVIDMGLVQGVHIVKVSHGRQTRSARLFFNIGN